MDITAIESDRYEFSGVTVRRLRREKKIGATAFGAALGKSPFTVMGYEAGRIMPSAPLIARMASLLNVEPGMLFARVPVDEERPEVVMT
jgi:transcriptional regulator with XRE-family HTH domain